MCHSSRLQCENGSNHIHSVIDLICSKEHILAILVAFIQTYAIGIDLNYLCPDLRGISKLRPISEAEGSYLASSLAYRLQGVHIYLYKRAPGTC